MGIREVKRSYRDGREGREGSGGVREENLLERGAMKPARRTLVFGASPRRATDLASDLSSILAMTPFRVQRAKRPPSRYQSKGFKNKPRILVKLTIGMPLENTTPPPRTARELVTAIADIPARRREQRPADMDQIFPIKP